MCHDRSELVEYPSFTALDWNALLAHKMFKRGDVLRFLREAAPRPMTQRELADRAGVSLGTVQRAEQGSSNVTVEMWGRLGDAVGMTPGEMDRKAADMTAVFDATREALNGSTEVPASASNSPGPGRWPTVTEDVYLQLLRRWWSDLDEADHERIVEFARATRIDRQALKKASGHPNE